MNSDQERELFERWQWTYDQVGRRWVAPEHGHAEFTTAMLKRRQGKRPEVETRMCEVSLSIDDVVAATRTPEGEGTLVGFVMSHGVKKR